MLPKSERLTKSSGFSAVYNLKRSVSNPLLILYTGKLKNSYEKLPGVGFVVGKKIHKKANKRNYVKRIMRESYRDIRKTTQIPIEQWQSLIFIARPAILEVGYKEVYDGIMDCLKKAHQKYGHRNLVRN